MELIRKKAFARAGLIGNPSDGYHGKTISTGLGNLWAQVALYAREQIEIVRSQEDRSRFDSIEQLADDVVLHALRASPVAPVVGQSHNRSFCCPACPHSKC